MIKNKTSIAAATQTVFWYADVKQATVEWNRHKVEPYFDFPTVASNTSSDKPASLLLCSTPQPDIQGICVYRAYWEHWYTEVEFYGAQSEDFRLSEMQKLTDRVDQLLMAAPDKPCQGFFCIGTNR